MATKDEIKVDYASQSSDFISGATLTAQQMRNIDAGILEAADAGRVAEKIDAINNSIGTIPENSNVMAEVEKKADQSNTYTKLQVDDALSQKANATDVQNALDLKGDKLEFDEEEQKLFLIRGDTRLGEGVEVATDLTGKGDSLSLQDQKLQLISTAKNGNTEVLAEVTLPEGVSNLKLTGDTLQLLKPNEETLGGGVSLAGYAKTDGVYNKADIDQMDLQASDGESTVTIQLRGANGKLSEGIVISKTTTAEYYQINSISAGSFSTIVGNEKTPQRIKYQVGHKQGTSWDTSPYYEKWTITKPNGAATVVTRVESFVDLTGSDIQEFDFTPYLSTGKNNVFLAVYTNPEYTGAPEKSRTWIINNIDFGFTATFPNPVPCNTEAIISCALPQNVIKTLVLVVDNDINNPITETLGENIGTYSFTLRSSEHGAHKYEIKMKTSIGEQEIETSSQFGSAIWYDINNPTPIIGLGKTHYVVEQYNETNITYLPFAYYNGSDSNKLQVEIYSNESGQENLIYTDEVTSNSRVTYKYPAETESKNISLTIKLRALNEVAIETITFVVNKGSYDFTPVAGDMISFSPKKYTNANFSTSGDLSLNDKVKLILGDNFDLTSGGFIRAGNEVYFKIPAYNRAYIKGAKLFNQDKDSHFKIVFKTANVRKKTVFLSSGSGEGLNYLKSDYGIKLDTEGAEVSGTDTIKANSVFATDIIIDYAFNIVNPSKHEANATYTDEDGNSIPKGYRSGDYQDLTLQKYMIMPYEDGVASTPKVYDKKEAGDLMFDTDDDCLEIGSDDCDVYIYALRAYPKALGIDDICTNFSIDAITLSERKKRYDRNNWFTTSGDKNILKNPQAAAELMPDVKIVLITAPYFTNDKKNTVENTYIQVLQNKVVDNDNKEVDNAAFNWITKGGTHCGQGTSSNEYGFSARNLTIKLGDTVYQNAKTVYSPTGDGDLNEYAIGNGWTKVAGKKIKIKPDSVANDVFNIKVNVASSENQNNALMARLYNLVNDAAYKRPAKLRDSNVKDTMEFDNCIIYIRETTTKPDERREFLIGDQESWHFYGIGNFGDSKDSDNTRLDNKWDKGAWVEDEKETIVEITDYNVALAGFNNVKQRCGLLPYIEGKESYSKDEYQVSKGEYWLFENILKYQSTIIENGVSVNRCGLYEYDSSKGKYKFEGFGVFPLATLAKDENQNEIYTKKIQCSYEFRYEKEGLTSSQRDSNIQNWYSFYEQVYNIYSNLKNKTYTIEQAKDELSNYMIVDSAILYFLFTERFCLIDNRAKNSFWHYSKKYYTTTEAAGLDSTKYASMIDNEKAAFNNGYRWDLCFGYDFDTALGIDNVGKYAFDYGLETSDRIFRTEVKIYDQEIKTTNGFNYFFELIQSFGYSELSRVYNLNNVRKIMSSSGNEGTILYWDKKQKEFPEKIWLRDIERKYIRISNENFQVDGSITKNSGEEYDKDVLDSKAKKDYLSDKANGLKRYHRREFERKQSLYMDSRWSVGEDIATFRFESGHAPGSITITFTQRGYYSTCLISDGGDWQTPTKNWKTVDGKLNLTNTTTADGEYYIIYPASIISSIVFPKNYSGNILKMNSAIDIANCTKLTEVSFGTENSSQRPRIGITNTSFDTNPLLTALNFDNCLSYEKEGKFGLSLINNLGFRTISAQNSGLTDISFAPNGQLEKAVLNESIKKLSLVNLSKLIELTIPSNNSLESLRLENCPLLTTTYTLINSVKDTLQHLRLTGINWTTETSSIDLTTTNNLFDQLGKLGGINEKGETFSTGGTEHGGSVLSGSAKVAKSSTRVKTKYDQWWDKQMTFVPAEFVEEVSAKFYNHNPKTDKFDKLIETKWTTKSEPLALPTKPSRLPTIDKTFAFKQWKNQESGALLNEDQTQISITTDVKYEATYTSSDREYTIKWLGTSEATTPTSKVKYGTVATYPKNTPPTKTAINNKIYLFSGWDKYPYFIIPELDEAETAKNDGYKIYKDELSLTANFKEGVASSKDSAIKTDLTTAKLEDINANCVYSKSDDTYDLESLYTIGDTIDITIGWDPDDEPTIPDERKPSFDLSKNACTVYDQSGRKIENVNITLPLILNQKEDNYAAVDTGIKLFKTLQGEDFKDKAFTMSIDFQFCDTEINGETISTQYLFSCQETGKDITPINLSGSRNSDGFKLNYGGSNCSIASTRDTSSGQKKSEWTGTNDNGERIINTPKEKENDVVSTWSASTYERCIIIKKPGDTTITIIQSNPTALTWTKTSLSSLYTNTHNYNLFLGCGNNATQEDKPDLNNRCNCAIYNFKVWNFALSDAEVEKMAIHPKETLTFQLISFPRTIQANKSKGWYKLKDSEEYPGILLEQRDLMKNLKAMKASVPSGVRPNWENSDVREWLNKRIILAMPTDWQPMIKTVAVKANNGATTNPQTTTTNDQLFLLCRREHDKSDNDGERIKEGWSDGSCYDAKDERYKFQEICGRKFSWFSRERTAAYGNSSPGFTRLTEFGTFGSDIGTATTSAAVSFAFCV